MVRVPLTYNTRPYSTEMSPAAHFLDTGACKRPIWSGRERAGTRLDIQFAETIEQYMYAQFRVHSSTLNIKLLPGNTAFLISI